MISVVTVTAAVLDGVITIMIFDTMKQEHHARRKTLRRTLHSEGVLYQRK
jgi:hypothetical protein